MRMVKFDASVLLLSLIAILLAGGIVFGVTALRPDPLRASVTGERVINTLFVIENGESPPKPLSSFVLMYYPATQRAALIDVPGSLGLILQRINRVDRIDSVYDSRRIAPFANEIERLLGIEISYSIGFNLENLGKIVDLIEGVEVFIPVPVDEFQDGFILFPSGLSFLDGDKAKTYITYELPEENSELITFRRQRFFMSFLRRLGEQNHFLNMPQAAQLFHSLLITGTNQRTQARLFNEFAGIDMDRVGIQSVAGNVREVSGQSLIFPLWDGNLIKEIVRETLGSLMRPLESYHVERVFTVEVLNGTAVTGLAGRTAEFLRGFGYDVISVGNADHNNYERTLIVDRSGYMDMARIFGDVIRCTNIRFDIPGQIDDEFTFTMQNLEFRSDFTLILGRDFDGRYVTP